MNCPSCRHENPAAANFCSGCGVKLRTLCPRCALELPPTAKFCHECGASMTATPLPSSSPEPPSLEAQFHLFQQELPVSFRDQLLAHVEGENRLVTVLFADMSRSVETTGDLHPEDAVALVNRLLRMMVDVLLRYQGRIDRFLGDGLLAVFGAPQAHEDDPERAVRAALEIRERAGELGLQVTAGINTGEVYVGEIGSERHQEVTVMGPVVNLASRLQKQAEPGQVLVGETTHRLTRRAFAFTPLSFSIKGVAQPVAAYAAERALPRPEKARGIEGLRAELIGRDGELAKLNEVFAELLQGRGQIVTLIGEAGVGKSRLVAELKQSAGCSGVQVFRYSGAEDDEPEHLNTRTPEHLIWLEGRCLELGMTASYWLFIDLFRDYFAWRPEEEERARAERLTAALRELAAQGHLTEERVEEMGPLLGNLLSLRFGNDWDERLKNAGPEQIRHQTFLAVRDFLVALARRQPLLLICEDLHWADSLSLDLISLLMEALTLAPILLLCVYRPEQEHKCWRLAGIAAQKCAGRCTEIQLRELSPGQSRQLVEALLTIDNLPPAVKELILERSRGNPFFVEEVVRSLIASGMIYAEGETWRAREGIETIAVPESIQSVILSRVDRLEREAKQVLESAAVIGRLFRRRLLAQMTRGEEALGRALAELEDQALIYQERAIPEEEYSFKHVLTQETVYGSILRRRRSRFHQQAAEAMESLYQDGLEEYYEQLAYHYERSTADEKAVEYLLKAGEKARLAYLNEEAISYFQRALARLEGMEFGEGRKQWRFEALTGLGWAHNKIGKPAEAEGFLKKAIALGQEIERSIDEIARLYFFLGETLIWQGKTAEVLWAGEQGLSLVGQETESLGAALMNEILAVGHDHSGDQGKWREFVLRNARFLQRLPYDAELKGPYDEVAQVYSEFEKNPEESMKWIEHLVQRAEQERDLSSLGQMYLDQGRFVLDPTGDLRGAIPKYQQAIATLRRAGDRHESWGWNYLTNALVLLGDIEKAEQSIREGLEIVETKGRKEDIALSRLGIGVISLCQGSHEAAIEAFRQAYQLLREGGLQRENRATIRLGQAYLALGRREEALEQFATVVTREERQAPSVLSGVDHAYQSSELFLAYCHRLREEIPRTSDPHFVQWYLEPTTPETAFTVAPALSDVFVVAVSADWSWQDPFGDCHLTVQEGLEIRASNGRRLGHINLSAPRLLRPVSGSVAVQTICGPVSEDKPAIGGLLLWKDKQNYLRLDRGTRGPSEINFQGCIDNQDLIIGRGRLPAERIFLRLERLGPRVNALCSADGESWFTVGHVEFPVEDPVEVGLHAIGMIDRTIYPGAYPEGTAIRFERFDLWQ